MLLIHAPAKRPEGIRACPVLRATTHHRPPFGFRRRRATARCDRELLSRTGLGTSCHRALESVTTCERPDDASLSRAMEDGTSKSVTHCRGTGYDNDPFQWDAREDCASPGPRPVVVDRASVEPQSWGQGCSAWPLVDLPDLSVKHEYVPAGAGEVLHVHGRARQFFFVLSGIAHV